ncbi:hypothetical protein L207DRAFT_575928 [Hyaloscypha variabilis F]|uniref:Uncharacterized protein n=1 Tax=Hyaloscypha variabilis (strain UAMH 11265 / GT02V1 / F) TaxID=1149755 RepID=A0A2J6S8Q3_HYAVF|nr:hypothetical protein L207DRAFT_575928 [Hyaloscypha variabilis F]
MRGIDEGTSLQSSIKFYILRGFSNTTLPELSLSAKCPTGNCTFDAFNGVTHSSLAICSRCNDVSMLITNNVAPVSPTINEDIYSSSLPDGLKVYFFSADTGSLQTTVVGNDDFSWVFASMEDEFRALLPFSFVNATILSHTYGPRYNVTFAGTPTVPILDSFPPPGAVAAVFILYPCIRRYFGEFMDGTLQETLLSEVPLQALNGTSYQEPMENPFFYKLDLPCFVEGQVYSAGNLSSFPSAPSFGGVLPTPSCCTTDYILSSTSGGPTTASLCTEFGSALGQAMFWLQSFANSNAASIYSISSVVENVTTAATTAIRLLGKDGSSIISLEDPFNFSNVASESWWGAPSGAVIGNAHVAAIYYQADWVWLLFPAAFLVMVFLLLLVTIGQTIVRRRAGAPTWKSSVLPLLFHGLLDPTQAQQSLSQE